MDMGMPAYSKKFAIIILCCLGIIIYSNSFDCPFHFDDELSIVSNLSIRNIANLRKIWDFWPTRFITYLSIAFNYHFHQFNVFGYHLINLAIHLACAIIVWWFILLTFSTPAMQGEKITPYAQQIAFFAGAIFLAHPIQTQTVTYIIQRATLLATFFYLVTLSLYVEAGLLQYERPRCRIWRFYYISSIIMAVMAMFTKEMAISLPLTAIIYETCFLRTKKILNWKRLAPFFITLSIIPLTMFLTKSVNFAEMRLASEPAPGISCWHYFLTQFRVMVTYLRLLFLPLNQNLDYDYPIAKSLWELPTLASFLLLSIIFFVAIRRYSKYRLISFPIFWFFLTLLPESSIIPIKDVIFEHRLYLPTVGYSLFLVSIIYCLFGNKSLRVMIALLFTIVTGYSVLTYNRNFVWKDELTLWNDTIRKSPRKARAYSERGNAYKNKGNFAGALSDYNKAIEVDPHYANAYNNRGIVYLNKSKSEDAIADFNKAIEINPESAFFYYNRGNAYLNKGNLEQAIADYSKAIEINRNFALAYHNRGSVYYDKGNLEQAIADYSKAIEIEPNLSLIYYNRGNAYLNKGNLEQAIADYSKAIQLNHNLVGAYSQRANAYFLKGDYHKSWQDVSNVKTLGYSVSPEFLKKLQRASGREE